MNSKTLARLAALDSSVAHSTQVVSKSAAERRAEALLAATRTESNITEKATVATQPVVPEAPLKVLGTQDVPLAIIRDNPFDARRVRRPDDERILAESIKKYGQQIPARGYWAEDGTCVLFYGHQRKRAVIYLGERTLKVDMVAPPENNKELYLVSRRENVERSMQTPLDDAIAWQHLLDSKVYETQDELAHAMGVEQATVAKTLAYTKLQPEVMNECIKHGILNRTMLYLLVLFQKEAVSVEQTCDLIKEIKDGKLSTRDIEARIKRLRLEREAGGPVIKRKPRADSHKVIFAGVRGELKEFSEKGRVELVIDLKDDETRAQLMNKLKDLFSLS